MYSKHAPITKTLARGENIVLTNPITRGITAPPETAIISNPEISLARSGIFSSESEKMIGNILPAPKPIIKIDARATENTGDTNTPATPISEVSAVSNRKTLGFIQFKIIAPINLDIVSPAKKALIPQAALSMVIPYFAIRIFEMLVLVATSTPTIKNMESAIKATKRFFSSPKHEAKVAGLRSGFDSTMGVINNHSAPRSEVIPYTARTNRQSP